MQFLESMARYNDQNHTMLQGDPQLPYVSWLYFRGNVYYSCLTRPNQYYNCSILQLKANLIRNSSISDNDNCTAMQINDTNSQRMNISCDTENFFICEVGNLIQVIIIILLFD